MEKQIEELKNELFSIKPERDDEVIIMDTVIHHDAEWMKIKFGYLTQKLVYKINLSPHPYSSWNCFIFLPISLRFKYYLQ